MTNNMNEVYCREYSRDNILKGVCHEGQGQDKGMTQKETPILYLVKIREMTQKGQDKGMTQKETLILYGHWPLPMLWTT